MDSDTDVLALIGFVSQQGFVVEIHNAYEVTIRTAESDLSFYSYSDTLDTALMDAARQLYAFTATVAARLEPYCQPVSGVVA